MGLHSHQLVLYRIVLEGSVDSVDLDPKNLRAAMDHLIHLVRVDLEAKSLTEWTGRLSLLEKEGLEDFGGSEDRRTARDYLIHLVRKGSEDLEVKNLTDLMGR